MADAGAGAAVLGEAALEAWGTEVGRAAVAGRLGLPLVIALRGPLGAGKSVLARAVARGAGVGSPMPSPTYNLLFEYDAKGGARVFHLDLYRLDDPEDVWELGWQELGEGRQVVLVEWPERAESLLPPDRWDVALGFVDAPDRRSVTVASRGRAPAPPPVARAGGEEAP